MAQFINTNIPSINAQRNLNKSQSMMETAMERLASGLRINSAKDDAAGLAISTRFDTQIKGLNQAVRNANDGISLAQTAEASMAEMTNTLQRMRELAVQAANSTNSDADRASIQSEVDQLYAELDRIAAQTSFNGTNVLNGGANNMTFQIGANSGETLSFSIDSVTTRDLNLNAASGLGELNGGRVATTISVDSLTNVLSVNGITLSSMSTSGGAVAVRNAVNGVTGQTGVTATSYNTYSGLGGGTGVTTGALLINSNTVASSGSMTELVSNINRDVSGVGATLNSDGSITLSNDTGDNIIVGGTVTNTGLTAATYGGYVSLTDSDGEAISIAKITTANTADLHKTGFNVSSGSDSMTGGAVTSALISVNDDIKINGVALGSSAGATAADKATAINAITDSTGVTADAQTVKTFSSLDFAQTVFNDDDIKINGVGIDLRSTGTYTVSNTDDVVSAINNTAGLQGVVASTNGTGELVLSSDSGLDLVLTMQTGARSFFGSAAADGIGSTTGNTEARLNIGGDAAIMDFMAGASLASSTSLVSAGDVSNRLTITLGGSVVSTQSAVTLSNYVGIGSTMTQSDFVSYLDGQTTAGAVAISAFLSSGQLIVRAAGGDTERIEVAIGSDSVTTGSAASNGLSAFTDISAGQTARFHDNAMAGRSVTELISANRTRGNVTLNTADGSDIIIEGVAVDVAKLGLSRAGGSDAAIGIGLSVSSLANASNSIERIDDALDQISTTRGDLGAIQNRLTTTISNLSTVSQNLSAANSRIKDADFAAETANMTKAQILQQAGISILSQANASSQSVLSLLG